MNSQRSPSPGPSPLARTLRNRRRSASTPSNSAAPPSGILSGGPFDEVPTPPIQLRWDPLPIPEAPTDFIDGLATIAGSGDPAAQAGVAVHAYPANANMQARYFYDADGELLLVPQ